MERSRYTGKQTEYFYKTYRSLRSLASLPEKEKLFELEQLLRLHDPITHRHSSQVGDIAQQLALLSGLRQYDSHRIYYGGLFHDIGKVLVPQSYINRLSQSDLLKEQNDLLISHGVKGAFIMRHLVNMDESFASICDQHWIGEIPEKPPSQQDVDNRHWYVPFVTIADLVASAFDYNRKYQIKYKRKDVTNYVNDRFENGVFPEYIRPAFNKLMLNNRYLRYL